MKTSVVLTDPVFKITHKYGHYYSCHKYTNIYMFPGVMGAWWKYNKNFKLNSNILATFTIPILLKNDPQNIAKIEMTTDCHIPRKSSGFCIYVKVSY